MDEELRERLENILVAVGSAYILYFALPPSPEKTRKINELLRIIRRRRLQVKKLRDERTSSGLSTG